MLTIRVIDLLTFSKVATELNKGMYHFDVASGPFKYIGALMWLNGTLKISSWKGLV